MGLGILESSALGFWALGPLAKKGAEPGEPGGGRIKGKGNEREMDLVFVEASFA